MSRLPLLVLPVLMMLVACAERYSPDTYATRAVQQANKVEQGERDEAVQGGFLVWWMGCGGWDARV